jgi:hypothetical protein
MRPQALEKDHRKEAFVNETSGSRAQPILHTVCPEAGLHVKAVPRHRYARNGGNRFSVFHENGLCHRQQNGDEFRVP